MRVIFMINKERFLNTLKQYDIEISEKQLERIFERESGLTVMEYVRKRKCIQIEKMLFDPSLSLRHISEIMNFNNELCSTVSSCFGTIS